MKSEVVEKALNDAVHKVVWGDTKPTEYVSDYVHKTMLAEDWDALEMLQYELMAVNMRKQYGFDLPTE
tara:strand:+ start:3294 stop:3497 length:204 start_codon:yes stop_codon:yes gene_type:complete